MLHGWDGCVRLVKVWSIEFAECASAAHILSIFLLCCIVLVYRHHVLHVVSFIREVWSLSNPATVFLNIGLLILRNETFRRLMVKSTQDLSLEALSRVVRVALSIEILWVDSGDEARVPRHTLVPNLMRRSIHPCTRCLAHIASHGSFLRKLIGTVHGRRAHIHGCSLLLEYGSARVNHGWFPWVAEIISSLSIAFTCCMTNDVQFEWDVARVAGDFLSALHDLSLVFLFHLILLK